MGKFLKIFIFLGVFVNINAFEIPNCSDNSCKIIQTQDDISDDELEFNLPIYNVAYNVLLENKTFNADFYNNEDAAVDVTSSVFNEQIINDGLFDGNNFTIKKKVINNGMFEGSGFTINGDIENNLYFFGSAYYDDSSPIQINGNFLNNNDGIFDGYDYTFGEQDNTADFTIQNHGMFYGGDNVVNYKFINKEYGYIDGVNYTFNKDFINEKNATLVGGHYIFNGIVTNDGEMFSDASSFEDNLKFSNNVINNNYIQGDYLQFEKDTENNGEIVGNYLEFEKLNNQGSISSDNLTIKQSLTNGVATTVDGVDLDNTPVIYGEDNNFQSTVDNYAMILGSQNTFSSTVTNGGYGWIVGDGFVFEAEVVNNVNADIIGDNFTFQGILKNEGTVDIVEGSFDEIINTGTIYIENGQFNKNIKNDLELNIYDSDINVDITSDSVKSSVNIISGIVNNNMITSNNMGFYDSKITSHSINSFNNLDLDYSILLTKSIKAKNILATNSVLAGSINADTLDATDSTFILYQEREKPLWAGFGGSIVVFDTAKGMDNKIQIANLNLSDIQEHFVPLLIAKNIESINAREDYLNVLTTKNLSVFGINKKYYAFKKIGDYYVAGLGDINKVNSDDVELLIKHLKPDGNSDSLEKTDFVSLALGEKTSDWELEYDAEDGLWGLEYIGPDVAELENVMDAMQTQMSVTQILKNSIFKRLGDIRQFKHDGMWTRYYNGNIKYQNSTTNYSSKNIGFDGYGEFDGFGGYAGVFVYDLYSKSTTTTSTSYGFGGYLSFIFDNGFFADGSLRYTNHDYTSIIFNEKVSKQYFSILSSFELGYDMSFYKNLSLIYDMELFYTYHPAIKTTGDIKLSIDKASDFSMKTGFKFNYDMNNKLMLGAEASVYFDLTAPGKYSVDDSYMVYDRYVEKDVSLKLGVLGSYKLAKNFTFSFGFEKGYFSNFILDHEINLNLRYYF